MIGGSGVGKLRRGLCRSERKAQETSVKALQGKLPAVKTLEGLWSQTPGVCLLIDPQVGPVVEGSCVHLLGAGSGSPEKATGFTAFNSTILYIGTTRIYNTINDRVLV
jgi:hypothetical protein